MYMYFVLFKISIPLKIAYTCTYNVMYIVYTLCTLQYWVFLSIDGIEIDMLKQEKEKVSIIYNNYHYQ